jgi:hypothetical protein
LSSNTIGRSARRTRDQLVKKPGKHRQSWTDDEVKELRQLAKENTPTRVMGLKLGRTESAVRERPRGWACLSSQQINHPTTAVQNDVRGAVTATWQPHAFRH